MRNITLVIAVAGAYVLLRGWDASPAILLRACLAIAALAIGLAIWGMQRNTSKPRMFCLRKATWLDYLSLGAAVIFTEACLVVLTSTLAAPAQQMVTSFRSTIADTEKTADPGSDAQNGSGSDHVKFDGEHSGDWQFSRNLDRQLPPKSNHKPSTKPEVFIELNNTEDATTLFNTRIYIRSFAFSKFNGISWAARKSTETKLEAPVTFPLPTAQSGSQAITHTIYHSSSKTGQNLFTSLQGAISTDVTELTRLAESVYLLPNKEDPTDGYSYTAKSHTVHFTDLINKSIKATNGSTDELDLPPEFAERLKVTAESFRHETTLANQLVALRNYMRDNFTYSLETTNPSGANPLENFLYQEKRGYCEHFATAAAMLCRTIGVPSRIAYGWSGGRLYQKQNMFVFRAKDAHAWTEIKLDGYGWVVFDTTPPDDEATPETHAAPDDEKAPNPTDTLKNLQLEQTQTQQNPLSLKYSPWALSLALAVIGICSILFLITRAFKQPPTSPDGRPLNSPPPGYLVHFKQACASLGHPMPTGRTLRQHIALLFQSHTAPDFAHELLEYHYNTIYANKPINPQTERHLSQMIRRWKKSHIPKK